MAYNLTAHGKTELENELADLRAAYDKVVIRVAEARHQGDLRENAEYENARAEQVRTQARIDEIEEILRNVEIIKDGTHDVVEPGAKVVLSDGTEYEVVGSLEASPQDGKISDESPLGQALLGKKVGDDIEIATPKGAKKCKVKKIS